HRGGGIVRQFGDEQNRRGAVFFDDSYPTLSFRSSVPVPVKAVLGIEYHLWLLNWFCFFHDNSRKFPNAEFAKLPPWCTRSAVVCLCSFKRYVRELARSES